MVHTSSVIAIVSGLLLEACATGPPVSDQLQPQAVLMAERRGQLELKCPAATGTVTHREQVQPLIQPMTYSGPTRYEYTVDVAGCGRAATYRVTCTQSDSTCTDSP